MRETTSEQCALQLLSSELKAHVCKAYVDRLLNFDARIRSSARDS